MSVQTKWYKVRVTVHQTLLVQVNDHGDKDLNEEDARWTAYEQSDLTAYNIDDCEAEIVELKEEDVKCEKRWADKVVLL